MKINNTSKLFFKALSIYNLTAFCFIINLHKFENIDQKIIDLDVKDNMHQVNNIFYKHTKA